MTAAPAGVPRTEGHQEAPVKTLKSLLITGSAAAILSLSGCAGQMKAAALEHARATKTIAMTVSKATEQIRCEDMKADSTNTCKAAVSTLNDQVKVLTESGDKLEGAAK